MDFFSPVQVPNYHQIRVQNSAFPDTRHLTPGNHEQILYMAESITSDLAL